MGMGGPRTDYVLYSLRDTKLHRLVPAALAGHRPPATFFAHAASNVKYPITHFSDWDYMSARIAVEAVHLYRPRALMVNLPGADYYGHPFGGPADPTVMRSVVEGLDRNIGRIVNAYKKLGIFDQTLWVITADHGMVPNDRSVGGKKIRAAVAAGGGDYYFHTGGTAAFIYVHNSEKAIDVAASVQKIRNVAGTYYLTNSDAGYQYEPGPGTTPSTALSAAWNYLMSTYACGEAPDVLAQYRENTIGRTLTEAYGYHGGMNWGAQSIPMIFSGPGVKAGSKPSSPARLTDIAPTALRLMGLTMTETDGTVLADAIASPTAAETTSQTSVSVKLAPYLDALSAAGEADIAFDKAHDVNPPKPLKPHP
jgi:hypothetical protein